MTPKRFKSKIDRWLLFILVGVMVFEVVVMSAAAAQARGPGQALALLAVTLGIIALIGSLLLRTHYDVDGTMLRIVSGPFCWKVPLDRIESVEATRSPLSSPALSLDRLRIRYGGKRRIMVSPADKPGFLKAIGQDLADGKG